MLVYLLASDVWALIARSLLDFVKFPKFTDFGFEFLLILSEYFKKRNKREKEREQDRKGEQGEANFRISMK